MYPRWTSVPISFARSICTLLPLCQQAFYGRFQCANKRSVRGHSRNDGIEHLSDSTAHRDGRIPCPDKATPGPSNELGRKSRRQNGAKSLSRFVFAQGFWQWNAEFTHRATTGYRFSPLFGFLRASREFATLHARSLKARGSKCDSGNFPWKTKFSRSLGLKSPSLRQFSPCIIQFLVSIPMQRYFRYACSGCWSLISGHTTNMLFTDQSPSATPAILGECYC